MSPARFEIDVAGAADREEIYRARHAAYAVELGQHAANEAGALSDALDGFNEYLVCRIDGRIAGFISVTDADAPTLSIEKYLDRADLPFPVDSSIAEVRLLTVLPSHRSSAVAAALMIAALRRARDRGAASVVAMGRLDLLGMYERAGLQRTGLRIASGAAQFEILHATVADLELRQQALPWARRIAQLVDLPEPAPAPAGCFHGGEFFIAIGTGFATLERSREVINADVLDAWFPPAPAVLDALAEYLPWLIRTSPPADCGGLQDAIADHRGIPAAAVLPGAGSSALIFLALGRWLTPRSRVLILDPTYGEYSHVLEKVIGCTVDRLPLHPAADFDVDTEQLVGAASRGYDLVVLVNPNSPTGRRVPAADLRTAIDRLPAATRVLIDETYIDYADPADSLEPYAAASRRTVVIKSMSKAYALSGLRAAYLCGPPAIIDALRAWTPPWAVGLPAQIAAVRALQSPEYYIARWAETAQLRTALTADIRRLGLSVVPGVANFLLCRLPDHAPAPAQVAARCAAQDVYIRDVASMGGPALDRHLRIAVKDPASNNAIIAALANALH